MSTDYKSRHCVLPGQLLDLVPVMPIHAPEIVRIRNQEHVRQFFDDKNQATLESQRAFYAAYAARLDDLYWVVTLKNGTVIGTNRLNEINGNTATKGSQAIDAAYINRGPYALEAEILLLRFAFNILGLHRVHAVIRPDNTKVISFNQKLGFTRSGACVLRGLEYEIYAATSADFQPEKFTDLIAYFSQRGKCALP